jgi:hypothetical protein
MSKWKYKKLMNNPLFEMDIQVFIDIREGCQITFND